MIGGGRKGGVQLNGIRGKRRRGILTGEEEGDRRRNRRRINKEEGRKKRRKGNTKKRRRKWHFLSKSSCPNNSYKNKNKYTCIMHCTFILCKFTYHLYYLQLFVYLDPFSTHVLIPYFLPSLFFFFLICTDAYIKLG